MSRKIAMIGVTAAVYAALTIALGAISYGPVQMRISEVMTLLAYVNPSFIPGLVLGTFLSNINSPTMIPDMIMGTAATWIAVVMMSRTKNVWLASLWPTLVNGVIIGLELYLFAGMPLLLTMAQVALGEFLVVMVIGCPLYFALRSKTGLTDLLRAK